MHLQSTIQKGSGTTTRLPRELSGSPPRYSDLSSLGGVVDSPRQLAVGRRGVEGSQQIHFIAGLRAGGGSERRDRFGGVRPSSDSCGIRFLI